MSDEKNPIAVIDSQLEEKQAKADGLAKEIQKAQNFLRQAEPEFFALQGGIQELKTLKEKLCT